jgi:hypothetical protein
MMTMEGAHVTLTPQQALQSGGTYTINFNGNFYDQNVSSVWPNQMTFIAR